MSDVDHKISGAGQHLANWKMKNWRMGGILLLLLMVLVLRGSELLSQVWGNAGMTALTQSLMVVPGEVSLQEVGQAEVLLLRQAVTYAPGNRSAWRGLGFALAAQGREDEALAAWRSAGDMAGELTEWGEQARKTERYEDALVWHKRALAIASDSGVPWYYLGLVYEDLGAWDDARDSFSRAEEGVDSQAMIGSLFFHQGWLSQEFMVPPDPATALRLYEAALISDRFKTEWERIAAHFYAGVILHRQGQLQEARQEFEWVVRSEPGHYLAHVQLAVVTWKLEDDVDQAEKQLEQAVALKPKEKWAYWWLGRIYEQVGRLTEAADAYRRVLEIDPADETALQYLGNWESNSNR